MTTTAIYRWTSPLFAWIPDLGAFPPRRRVALGVAVSLLFHLLIILALLLITPPKAPVKPPMKISFAKPKPKMRGIELTIMPPDPEPAMPFTLAPPEQPFIESRGLEISEVAADKPIFESDENMKAGSDRAGSGDLPLPSQDGRNDRPFNAFKTQRSLLGSASVPAAQAMSFPPSNPAPTPPTQAPPAAQAEPPAPSEPIPEPQKPVEPAKEIVARPPASPTDLPQVEKPNDHQIALAAKPSSTPPPAPKSEQTQPSTPTPTAPQVDPAQKMAMLKKPTAPPRESSYEPEQEQTRIEGSITNRGPKGVDAIATPMGKFKRQVNNVIGSRWLYYVKDPRHMSLYSVGSARVVFYITSEGRIERLKVEANTSNQSFADMCLAAISDAQRNDAEIFQPPPGAMEAMRDGRLEYTITFTLY